MKKLAFVALALIATLAKADPVLLDRSPDAFPTATLLFSSTGNWGNSRESQHFVDDVSFVTGVSLTGMGLYSGIYWGALGQTVTIQLWSDSGGSPGTLLNEFQETIDAINTDGASGAEEINQKYVDFTNPLNLSANTVYWIGMSGGDGSVYNELALLGLGGAGAPDDGSSFQYSGDIINGHNGSIGDVSMRLYGTGVPDGGSTAGLIGAVLVGLVAIRRKLAA